MPEFSFVFGVYREGRENEKCQSLVLFLAFIGRVAKTKNARVWVGWLVGFLNCRAIMPSHRCRQGATKHKYTEQSERDAHNRRYKKHKCITHRVRFTGDKARARDAQRLSKRGAREKRVV
jgi:hypothetical protein